MGRWCDDRLGQLRARAGWPLRIKGRACRGNSQDVTSEALERLIERHWSTYKGHINATSMADTLRLLGSRPATIVETGSSAWGPNSTVLWSNYVRLRGGSVWSVDIRVTPARNLVNFVSSQTTLVCDDSVAFLRWWASCHAKKSLDLVYLDSWDVAFSNPMPAAIHCLNEFFAIESHLKDGALLLVDDTPGSADWIPTEFREIALAFHAAHGVFPGKGMLVDLLLQKRPGVQKIHHRYQSLYQFA